MNIKHTSITLMCLFLYCGFTQSSESYAVSKAWINGEGQDWKILTSKDFINVNGNNKTWTWRKNGILHCSGRPISVMRYKDKVVNFEMVCEWRHLKHGGNSGIFTWATEASISQLAKSGHSGLPHGIEVQVLDLGYGDIYKKSDNNEPVWFTSHGDVFSVGEDAYMDPFPPIAPVLKGKSYTYHRSFPSKNLTKGTNEWNHYYIRCINGEVRLWVNGEEVSGGSNCRPASGYLCMESEGAPIDFRNLRIRLLP